MVKFLLLYTLWRMFHFGDLTPETPSEHCRVAYTLLAFIQKHALEDKHDLWCRSEIMSLQKIITLTKEHFRIGKTSPPFTRGILNPFVPHLIGHIFNLSWDLSFFEKDRDAKMGLKRELDKCMSVIIGDPHMFDVYQGIYVTRVVHEKEYSLFDYSFNPLAVGRDLKKTILDAPCDPENSLGFRLKAWAVLELPMFP